MADRRDITFTFRHPLVDYERGIVDLFVIREAEGFDDLREHDVVLGRFPDKAEPVDLHMTSNAGMTLVERVSDDRSHAAGYRDREHFLADMKARLPHLRSKTELAMLRLSDLPYRQRRTRDMISFQNLCHRADNDLYRYMLETPLQGLMRRIWNFWKSLISKNA
jgi:hypothetical protein